MSYGVSIASGAANLSGVIVLNSGQTITQASGSWLASGIVPNISGQSALISGQNVVVSSGAISVVSGSITVNSGTVSVSGMFNTAAFQSGGWNVSGVIPIAMMQWDLSGGNWLPVTAPLSGGRQAGVTIMAGNQQPIFTSNIGAIDGEGGNIQVLATWTELAAWENVWGNWSRVRTTTSGDSFRLRTSTEGQAPTYSVTATISGVFSGIALNSPIFGLFNYGSGTAIQSGSAYKIKSLYITSDNVGQTSGFALKFNIMRFTSFSGIGAGTLLSGVSMDTRDPVYSGTLAGPTLFQLATSGIVQDGVFFPYSFTDVPLTAVSTAGFSSGIGQAWMIQANMQETNLIQLRMPDTKEIIIRSGYGFGVQQASGYGYTQVNSGILGININMVYSVEGMTYTV